MNADKIRKGTSVSQSAMGGAVWMLFGSIFQIVVQIGIISVLARLLSPTDFGVVGVMMLFVSFTYIFTQLGIGASLIQMQDITPKHISVGYTLSIVLGLIICIIFFFLAPLLGKFFNLTNLEAPIRFFSFFFPIKSFNSVSEALLQRRFKFRVTVKANSIAYLVGFGLTSITMAYLGYGYWSIIYGQLVQLLIYTILLVVQEKPSFSFTFDKAIFRQLTSFGTGHTLATVFNYFAENADNMTVGKFLGPAALGIYSRAFQFLSIPSRFFGSIFDNVLFPVLSSKQKETKTLSGFYIFSLSFCHVLLLPISFFLIINAHTLIYILLGPKWDEVVYPFQILIVGLAFRFGTKINKSFLKSLGLVFKGAYYQLIFALLIIGLSYTGAITYGLPGVAYGVLIATVVNYFQISYRLHKVLSYSVKDFFFLHIRSVLFDLPMVLVLILIYNLHLGNQYITLGISLVVYIPLFLWITFNGSNVLFRYNNQSYLGVVIKNLPSSVQKVLMRTKFYKNLYGR